MVQMVIFCYRWAGRTRPFLGVARLETAKNSVHARCMRQLVAAPPPTAACRPRAQPTVPAHGAKDDRHRTSGDLPFVRCRRSMERFELGAKWKHDVAEGNRKVRTESGCRDGVTILVSTLGVTWTVDALRGRAQHQRALRQPGTACCAPTGVCPGSPAPRSARTAPQRQLAPHTGPFAPFPSASPRSRSPRGLRESGSRFGRPARLRRVADGSAE